MMTANLRIGKRELELHKAIQEDDNIQNCELWSIIPPAPAHGLITFGRHSDLVNVAISDVLN